MNMQETQPFFEFFNHSTGKLFYRIESVVTPNSNKCMVITPAHYGQTIEIIVTKNIGGTAVINGRQYEIKPKNVFYIPPSVVHSLRYISGGDFICVCKIDVEAMAQYLGLKTMLQAKNIPLGNISTVCDKFDQVYDAICRIDENSEDIFVVLHSFLDLFDALTSSYAGQDTISYDEDLYKLINYIDANYSHKLTLEEVAHFCGYNKRYFCRKFKQLFGETFTDFVNTVRVSKSCELLSQGKSVQTAAFACGFNSVPYYIRTFKNILGTVPSDYRKH